MDHLGELNKFIEMFEAKIPPAFTENFAEFKEVESRLIEIRLPKLMWEILNRGIEASKKAKIKDVAENIDVLLNDNIVTQMFLPQNAEHAQILLAAMREITVNKTLGKMLGNMRSIIEKSEKHKEKGYE